MSNEETPIIILTDDDNNNDNTPLIVENEETPVNRVSDAVNQASVQAQDAMQRAWQSDKRRQMTDKMQAGVSSVLNKSSDAVQTRVNQVVEEQAKERIRQIDWQEAARSGVKSGLRWASQRLQQLADRFEEQPQSATLVDESEQNNTTS